MRTTLERPALWNLLAKTTATPLRPVVRALFGRQSLTDAWRDFEPTASSVAELTVDASASSAAEAIDRAELMLRRHGVVVIAGAVGADAVAAASAEVDALISELEEQTSRGSLYGDNPEYFWQVGHSFIPTYFGMINHEKPVVFIRAREADVADAGMIDIFQFDRLAALKRLAASQALLDSRFPEMAAEIIRRVLPFNKVATNLYHNASVTNTRGLHIDSLGASYKAFLYLRDVLVPKDGPYSFVPGSHSEGARLSRSVFLNRSRRRSECDMPEVKGKEVAMLAPRGSIIISSQAGIHGGYPQQEGGLRTAIVRNYLNVG